MVRMTTTIAIMTATMMTMMYLMTFYYDYGDGHDHEFDVGHDDSQHRYRKHVFMFTSCVI